MMSNEQRKIPRLQFGQLLSKAWRRSATTSNGVSGFRTTGIHPFDPSGNPIHALSMSQVHAEDEARQLQPETHSSQSIRVKSAPSTSNEHAGLESHESSAYEVNTNVNTPRKVLQKFLLTNSVAQEPEGSSPHSQQPATGPCPETVESNPHPPSQSP
jgi:hypothetical protein